MGVTPQLFITEIVIELLNFLNNKYYNKAIEKGYTRSMINLASFYESKNSLFENI